jgi:hypothetical protein
LVWTRRLASRRNWEGGLQAIDSDIFMCLPDVSRKNELPARNRRARALGGDSIRPEEVAIVACARRELLLRVHRHRLYRSGVRPIREIIRDNPLAQDYLRWGLPGPGRWVTIYATTSPSAHAFITIAGLRLDTSHRGTDIGPNASEDGPRWRILDHIPTWAHWSVRHPPGL